jgi:hypothetical protein
MRKWRKVSVIGYLTDQYADQPGKGVWLKWEVDPNDPTHTTEYGAKDGKVRVVRECYSGQQRHYAMLDVQALLK